MPEYGASQAQYGFTEEQLKAPDPSFFEYTEKPEWISVIATSVREGWSQETIFEIWGIVYPISFVLTLAFAVGSIYCAMRILQIRRAEWAQFRKIAHTVEAEDIPATHLRWRRILEHAQSADEHKWRLAILECDIMLNELLDLQGYKGETIAEKMKQVSRSNFNTIDDAWEAHKVRNKVAHEGVEYHISEREKNHVINLYQRVFKEFGFI
jgi:hypothetical protein